MDTCTLFFRFFSHVGLYTEYWVEIPVLYSRFLLIVNINFIYSSMYVSIPTSQFILLHYSPVAYWAPTDWGVHLLVFYLFAFSYCSWGSQGKNTEEVCHSLLQWTTFCQTSPPWPAYLGWPHSAWLSFIELDKAVVLVWLDWLVFYEYGFSVSSLWRPLATPTVLFGFLLPWTWGISSQLL